MKKSNIQQKLLYDYMVFNYNNQILINQISELQKEIQSLNEKNTDLSTELLKKNRIISILMERYDVSPYSTFLQN